MVISSGKIAYIAVSIALLGLSPQPSFALISDSEAVNALEKARILAPTIRINARVGQDEVEVATYKNPKANLNDCKIEAVLIAKTLMDLSPSDVARVSVYFYNSSSLSTFKKVTVTAGDVKAFATGSLSKDELLKSLAIKEDTILDPAKRVASYLSEGQYAKPNKVTTLLKDNQVFISTAFDSNLSERLLKLEALKMADQALEAAPVEFKTAQVTFIDHGSAKENRVLQFSRENVASVGDALNESLKDVKIEVLKASGADGHVDLQAYELKDGLRREERANLLAILRSLDKAGVNVGKTNIAEFLAIDELAATADDAELSVRIEKLAELLNKYEENLKNAKDYKPVGNAKPGGAGGAVKPEVKAQPNVEEGGGENLKARILANPAAHVAAMEARLAQKTKSHLGEDHPNFPIILKFVIDTLKENGRAAEAVPYEERLAKIQAKGK